MSDQASSEGEFASWQGYWSYSKTVRRERRYVWPRAVREFLEVVRRTAKKRELVIPKDQPFFRAQVGFEQDVEVKDDGTVEGPVAFGPKRMKPTASHALDYRANAAGSPVLYLALEIETAIAEVRPWFGSDVSVSQFRTTRELRGLDLTPEFGKHWMPAFSAKEGKLMPVDADGAEKSVWTNIDNAFSRPVSRSDDPADYVPTQILAELFRAEGYEAIIYRSQLGEQGHNVVIFNLADADAQDGRPYKVTKIGLRAEETGNPWIRTPMSKIEIIFEVTEDEVDGGYSASARGYGIHTQGDSIEDVRRNVREAVDCYFEEAMERPGLIRLHFVRDEGMPA